MVETSNAKGFFIYGQFSWGYGTNICICSIFWPDASDWGEKQIRFRIGIQMEINSNNLQSAHFWSNADLCRNDFSDNIFRRNALWAN